MKRLFPTLAILCALLNTHYSLANEQDQSCSVRAQNLAKKILKFSDNSAWNFSGYFVGAGNFCKFAGQEFVNLLEDLGRGNSFNVLSTEYVPKSQCFKLLDYKLAYKKKNLLGGAQAYYEEFLPEYFLVGSVRGAITSWDGAAHARSSEERGFYLSNFVMSVAAVFSVARGGIGIANLGADALSEGVSTISSHVRTITPSPLYVGASGGLVLDGAVLPRAGSCAILPDVNLFYPTIFQHHAELPGIGWTPEEIKFSGTPEGQKLRGMDQNQIAAYMKSAWIREMEDLQVDFVDFLERRIQSQSQKGVAGNTFKERLQNALDSDDYSPAEVRELKSFLNRQETLYLKLKFAKNLSPGFKLRGLDIKLAPLRLDIYALLKRALGNRVHNAKIGSVCAFALKEVPNIHQLLRN